MDMRAFGKGFHRYYQEAEERWGVKFTRCRVPVLRQDFRTNDLLINTPSEGATFQPGDTMEIAGIVSDDRGISTLELQITGSGHSLTEDITNNIFGDNQWRYVWDTDDDISGDFKITVKAWDMEQNYNSTYRTVHLTSPEPPRDRKPPTVTLDYPPNGHRVSQDSVLDISGTARDDMGIALVSVSVDGGSTYQNADLITYPSTYEGFGNAFLETLYFRKPILCNRYSIYRTDIEPCGFDVILLDGFLTDADVQRVRWVIDDAEYREQMVEHNFRVASQFFSYDRVEAELNAILSKPRLARCCGTEGSGVSRKDLPATK